MRAAPMREPSLNLSVDAEALRPLIAAVVAETIEQLGGLTPPDNALCYSEEQAARLLELEPHVLRDERRRGRISASSIVGRPIRYHRKDLEDYLKGRRTDRT